MPKPPLPDPVTELLARPKSGSHRHSPAPVSSSGSQPLRARRRRTADGEHGCEPSMAGLRPCRPRVSITVLDTDDWSRHLSVQGGCQRLDRVRHLARREVRQVAAVTR